MAVVIGAAVAGAVVTGAISAQAAKSARKHAPGENESSLASAEYTRQQAAFAGEQADLWRSSYRPVEEAMAGEALAAGSAERQEFEAERAGTDVQTGYQDAREAMGASLSRRHISTDSPAYVQALAGLQLGEAKSGAGERNRARISERDAGFQKRYMAANVGRNSATSSNTGLGMSGRTMDSLGRGEFARDQYLQNQAREGVAPVAGAIGDWAGEAAGEWIRSRQKSKTTAAPSGRGADSDLF
jgi:hypothetical protein